MNSIMLERLKIMAILFFILGVVVACRLDKDELVFSGTEEYEETTKEGTEVNEVHSHQEDEDTTNSNVVYSDTDPNEGVQEDSFKKGTVGYYLSHDLDESEKLPEGVLEVFTSYMACLDLVEDSFMCVEGYLSKSKLDELAVLDEEELEWEKFYLSIGIDVDVNDFEIRQVSTTDYSFYAEMLKDGVKATMLVSVVFEEGVYKIGGSTLYQQDYS